MVYWMLQHIRNLFKDNTRNKYFFYTYFALITFLLLKSKVGNLLNKFKIFPFNLPNFDKFAHFVAFIILGFLLKIAYPKISYFWAFFSLTFYGILIEILQENFVKGRSGDIKDLLFDMIGITFGLLLHSKFQLKKM